MNRGPLHQRSLAAGTVIGKVEDGAIERKSSRARKRFFQFENVSCRSLSRFSPSVCLRAAPGPNLCCEVTRILHKHLDKVRNWRQAGLPGHPSDWSGITAFYLSP